LEPVFIVGLARTGSKLYRDILDQNTEIDVLNELHYCVPRWIKKDFRHAARPALSATSREQRASHLVRLMFSESLHGTFWRKTDGHPNHISDFEPESLRQALMRTDLSHAAILRTLLEEHARLMGKKQGGAKNAVNLYDFLGIPFVEEMLSTKSVGSSFLDSKRTAGFDRGTLVRWRSSVSTVTTALISGVLWRERAILYREK
jgi:hypothetical protein